MIFYKMNMLVEAVPRSRNKRLLEAPFQPSLSPPKIPVLLTAYTYRLVVPFLDFMYVELDHMCSLAFVSRDV